MRHFPSRSVLRILALVLLAAPTAMFAQTGDKPPAPERGWGSTWLEPANEQQRQKQELVRQMNAMVQARNFHSLVELDTRLVALEPNSPGPFLFRAWAFRQLKQLDRALADVDRAQTLAQKENRPGILSNVLVSRASIHEMQKDYAAAISDLQASLKLNDKNREALNDLAWLRATAPDATVRDGREGVRLAQKAVALSATANSYAAIDTLAAAYAESSDYARALDSERRAMTTAVTQIKDVNQAKKFQKDAAARLQLFEQHQAYHANLP